MADKIYGDQTARAAALLVAQPTEEPTSIVAPVTSGNPVMQDPTSIDAVQNNIQAQITSIQNNPLEVDVGALVGTINDSFNTMKNRITDAALASVKKSALELDAYFNSPTGDQRAGARIRMAESVKGNLIQSAYQAISAVYEQHTKDVIQLALQGAQINASIAGQKANAIVSLMGQQTSAYLGVLSESNKVYLAQLDNSLEMTKIQLDTQYKYDQLDQQASQFDITTSFNYDQLRQDQEKFQATLNNQREQFSSQLDFEKYKQEQTTAFNNKQLEQSRDLNQQQIDIQKSQVAMDSTAKMMTLLSGASPNKSYTASDITTVYKSMSGKAGVPDSTILSMSGWPDQDRVSRFMSTVSGGATSPYQQYVDYNWSKALADAKKGTNIS